MHSTKFCKKNKKGHLDWNITPDSDCSHTACRLHPHTFTYSSKQLYIYKITGGKIVEKNNDQNKCKNKAIKSSTITINS